MRSASKKILACVLVAGLIGAGMLMRISAMTSTTLWLDEAESAINGLTILETGLPGDTYLGLPMYENTLTEQWEGHPEYEFRDSSYSHSGVAVYHGWLPLYSIAAAQALFQMKPDVPSGAPEVLHGVDEIGFRTVVPRLPALLFSFGTMVTVFLLARNVAGLAAGLAALLWISLADVAVDLGSQSRYYSLTLLMTTLVVTALWRAVNSGSWASFFALGIAEGLLFHTHQLSSVVFAAAASIAIPWLMLHDRWIAKSAAAVAIALLLTVPWALWSGFFETASNVPKVFLLFESWRDWVGYIFRHPLPLLMVIPAVLLIAALHLCPDRLPDQLRTAAAKHAPIYAFLLIWMTLIYGAFHTLVPAASYFENRLTLMLLVPYIFLLALFIADVSSAIPKLSPVMVSLVLAFLSLVVIHRVYRPTTLSPDFDNAGIPSIVSTLQTQHYGPDTRFYATPNEHLVNTYYTGLPIQSIAPVRSTFLNEYPGTIVFLEKHRTPPLLPEETIRDAAAPAGVKMSTDRVRHVQRALWEQVVSRNLEARELPSPQPTPLQGVSQSLQQEYEAFCEEADLAERTFLKRAPIFRDVSVERNEELWNAFYVRFVDYRSRVGKRANIYTRLKSSEVTYVPEALTVVYRSPGAVFAHRSDTEPAPSALDSFPIR